MGKKEVISYFDNEESAEELAQALLEQLDMGYFFNAKPKQSESVIKPTDSVNEVYTRGYMKGMSVVFDAYVKRELLEPRKIIVTTEEFEKLKESIPDHMDNSDAFKGFN